MIDHVIEMETFDYEELKKQKGLKKHGFMDIASQADGAMMRIPYCIIVGEQDGPTLLIDGGIHGDEVEAADAAAHVYQELDPKDVRGIYIAVPHLNLAGFNGGQRMNSYTDVTHADMNRIFPGDPNGKITAFILDKFVNHFVKYADYWVTCHSGGNILYLTPTACYTNPELDTEFGDLTLNMAKCFQTPILWKNDPSGGRGGREAVGATSARELAEVWHKAYICLELGGNTAFMEEREAIYDMAHDGIMDLLVFLKMKDGEIRKFREDAIETPVDYLHILHGGIYKPKKRLLEKCKKGDLLGIVTNIFGETIDELYAPYDGIVVGSWTPPVVFPRDWACLYGKL
ncbi:MAG: succinylglutamate desuccinylase/aspartoacylase family protein [Lachnospiraceae bacterium]|nr:succinylglutamate desuccinylase/aspartoacylase family protein [Lachnospiraceae bacterium]MBR2533103.1 succinylglutamate desuccinylase/aspartoacylase family protein [Lachnospiraceae bacterium]